MKIGLMDGHGGLCLFCHELYRITGENYYFEQYNVYLERIYDSIINEANSFDLKSGLAGIMWLFKYLDSEEKSFDLDKPFYDEVKELLRTVYKSSLDQNNWEYMRGALGCLHILDDEDSYRLLLDYLESHIINGELYSSYYHNQTNLGLPYGILSILNYLSHGQRFGGIAIRISNQINSLLNILSNNEQISENYIFYPALSNDKFQCRLAWCYGELTIAFQLLLVVERTNNNKMKSDALHIAAGSVKRNQLDDTMILDACLQQGASGLFLLYHHLYSKTNNAVFQNAYKYWQSVTINFLEQNNFMLWERHKYELYKNHSLLEGLAGIGLSLLSPSGKWTSVMLL